MCLQTFNSPTRGTNLIISVSSVHVVITTSSRGRWSDGIRTIVAAHVDCKACRYMKLDWINKTEQATNADISLVVFCNQVHLDKGRRSPPSCTLAPAWIACCMLRLLPRLGLIAYGWQPSSCVWLTFFVRSSSYIFPADGRSVSSINTMFLSTETPPMVTKLGGTTTK